MGGSGAAAAAPLAPGKAADLDLPGDRRGRAVYLAGWFAGSDPDQALTDLFNNNVGIDLKANVVDPREMLYSGTVLINPAPFSSSVNVKMVDMMATGLPSVSAAAGVAGLSAEIKSLVRVCDTADEFAVQSLSRLDRVTSIDSTQRALAEQQFGIGMLKSALGKMKSVIGKSATRRNGGEAR